MKILAFPAQAKALQDTRKPTLVVAQERKDVIAKTSWFKSPVTAQRQQVEPSKGTVTRLADRQQQRLPDRE